ncbi:MAG: hypothetical protein LLF76_13550 [Planctomycetaceae bacterium]|nr:hypothetical protein [Planctomycetaceae bacterium]
MVRSLKFLVCVAMLAAMPLARAAEDELIGEGNDGNRSAPVHVFELFDAQGNQIRGRDENPKPFSLKQTCGKCHDCDKIAAGWHFNSHDPNVNPGRPSQPWVLTDSVTRTQLPISGRRWPGSYAPEDVGLSPWDFLKEFWSHFPGGSYGEMPVTEPGEKVRKDISGDYEINCLACHHNSPQEDQSLAALQAARQNFRWIPAASSGKAVINGVASELSNFFDPEFDEGIKVAYNPGTFDKDDMVFFDVSGQPINDRCYFCHSNKDLRVGENNEWTQDQDVHLQSGLNCVDCHRNGDDHKITRGIETEGEGKGLTCQGCHLGIEGQTPQEIGRLGAPRPKHIGIPPIHFEKLTCTACHSATWPEQEAARWQTARMHRTGLHGKHKLDVRQPHVYAPVLMKGPDGKIGPYKLFWPAYWGVMDENGKVTPKLPKTVLKVASDTLEANVEKQDDWRPLTQEQIGKVLSVMKQDDSTPVYIAGGELYRLEGEKVVSTKDEAAAPYAWAMAHDVRPAQESLGVRQCKDCHTADSAFFFGTVERDTPVRTADGLEQIEMVQLQGLDRFYVWAFNVSFVFRPVLKVVAFAACGLIALLLLAYGLKALTVISNACAQEEP